MQLLLLLSFQALYPVLTVLKLETLTDLSVDILGRQLFILNASFMYFQLLLGKTLDSLLILSFAKVRHFLKQCVFVAFLASRVEMFKKVQQTNSYAIKTKNNNKLKPANNNRFIPFSNMSF